MADGTASLNIERETPAWTEPFFDVDADTIRSSRYKGAHGGRGSGKSHFFAELLVERCVADPDLSVVCIREIQKSLATSVKRTIEAKIHALGVAHLFDIQRTEIRSKNGKGVIIFVGMQSHTAETIKSLEGFGLAWVEEAQSLSHHSLRLLRPTIRAPGSEIWFTWNPQSPEDAVEELLRGPDASTDAIVVEVNWRENPFFPEELEKERQHDLRHNQSTYAHVWEGAHAQSSHRLVFSNWSVEDFTAPDGVHFRFGADWGYARDPTAVVRCFIDPADPRKLYIDHEIVEVGVETEDLPAFFARVPGTSSWPIVADSARPETISYCRRHGKLDIIAAKKGKGSIEDGIEFLRSKVIIVHPRCSMTIKELAAYSYAVDENERVLPSFAKNQSDHCLDALRYCLEGVRRLKTHEAVPVRKVPQRSPFGPRRR